MASPNSVKILEVCEVAPAINSSDSATELPLPLTFFDSAWLKFTPTQSLFFYRLTESTSNFFHSTIVPKIKHSLSQTLLRFLPLAGQLTWPLESPRPIILYSQNDTVSLTIAESDANFDSYVDSKDMLEAIEWCPFVSKLSISETMASTMSLQITLFPRKGFSIGITTHHAIFDGKSAFMFLKALSFISKNIETLSPDLTPSFNRAIIKDPSQLESMYLKQWMGMTKLASESNPRSLKVLPFFLGVPPKNLVRSSFHLSSEKIKKLRERVLLNYHKQKNLRLSKFVIICSYASVCLIKARQISSDKKVVFVFQVDCRGRFGFIDPPIPQNYCGNAVCIYDMVAEARDFMEENGVAIIAERLSDCINGLEKGLFEGVKERVERLSDLKPELVKFGIAGSTQLGFYDVDFGWGRPEKVKILSNNAISIMEGKDGNGDVEIGLDMLRHEMEAFHSLFVNGLNDVV